MVDKIQRINNDRYRSAETERYEHPCPLIQAIIDEDHRRIENLLPREESDPTRQHQGFNAYQHASSSKRNKKIDLQLIIVNLQLRHGIELSNHLKKLHQQAITTANEQHRLGEGPSIYNAPDSVDVKNRLIIQQDKGKGILV